MTRVDQLKDEVAQEQQPVASLGVSKLAEAGKVTQVMDEVVDGDRFERNAMFGGQLEGGRVDDVAIELEKGGVVEG